MLAALSRLLFRPRVLLAALVLVGIAGCVGGGPSYNTPFRNVTSAEGFEGDYSNISEPRSPTSLSQLIWPRDPGVRHDRISTVRVRSIGRGRLRVSGLDAGGAEITSATFEEGKDFRLRNGVIEIDSKVDGAAAPGLYPMGPMAAVAQKSVMLGLDEQGNAQRVTETTSAGVLVVVPFVNNWRDGIRFPRK